MLHGLKLRKIVYILTHHKTKSMTLMLKLFLFHILYACGNKITPFSSACVNSQNFKICNLNCTVLLTLGEKHFSLSINWNIFTLFTPLDFCFTFPLRFSRLCFADSKSTVSKEPQFARSRRALTCSPIV